MRKVNDVAETSHNLRKFNSMTNTRVMVILVIHGCILMVPKVLRRLVLLFLIFPFTA